MSQNGFSELPHREMAVGADAPSSSGSAAAAGNKCTSFPTSCCRLIKDLHSGSKTKSETAAAALGQFITMYLDAGPRRSGRNGTVSVGDNKFERCCTSTLDSIWQVLADLEPERARNVLRFTRIATIFDQAPGHLHHAALRAHISNKDALMLSRQLHGVSLPVLAGLLPNFSHLLRLDLSHNALTEDEIPELGHALAMFTGLLHLDLSSNSIGEDGAESLAQALTHLRNLRLLALNSTLLEDEGLAHVARAIATPLDIRHLALAKNGITSDGAVSLQQGLRALPKLAYLDLQGNDLQGGGITAICDSLATPRLSYLDVSENSLSGDGVAALAAALPRLSQSHLHYLNLSGNGIEAEDAPAVAKVLTVTGPGLTSLELSDNDLQDAGLMALQSAFASMGMLRSLNISGNDATSDGFVRLSPTLALLSSLRRLDISYQPSLAGAGVTAFAESLKQLPALCALMLISAGLDSTGVTSLAPHLTEVSALTSLHLSHNPLGAEGVAALFRAVAKVPSLSHVSVGYADLGPRAPATIGPALQGATQLHFLDLRYNALRVQGTVALLHYLKHLKELKSVVLEGNGVEEVDDVRSVQKSLRGVKVWLNVGARIA